MCFVGFLRVQIHSWNATFREPCSPFQSEEQPELFFQAVPFIYVNCWTGGRKEL